MKLVVDEGAGVIRLQSDNGNFEAEFSYWQTLGLKARLEVLARQIEPPIPPGKTYRPKQES